VENGLETLKSTEADVEDVVDAGPLMMSTVGAGATTVQLCVADPKPPALPAATTRVCGPSGSPIDDQGLEQAVAGPLSRAQVTVADGSETLNDTSASVADVLDEGPPVTLTFGAAGGGLGVGVGVGVGAGVGLDVGAGVGGAGDGVTAGCDVGDVGPVGPVLGADATGSTMAALAGGVAGGGAGVAPADGAGRTFSWIGVGAVAVKVACAGAAAGPPVATTTAEAAAATAGPPALATVVAMSRSAPRNGICATSESGPVAHSRRGSEIARNARTMFGSKCVPAQRVNSSRALSVDMGRLYERAAVITS
jgi:hypothetical protein